MLLTNVFESIKGKFSVETNYLIEKFETLPKAVSLHHDYFEQSGYGSLKRKTARVEHLSLTFAESAVSDLEAVEGVLKDLLAEAFNEKPVARLGSITMLLLNNLDETKGKNYLLTVSVALPVKEDNIAPDTVMTAEQYSELALKTDQSPEQYQEVASRITADHLRMLYTIAEDIKHLSKAADLLKKVIFYNSNKPEVLSGLEDFLAICPPLEVEAKTPENLQQLHGILGLFSEVGELAQPFQDSLTGEVDHVNLIEEISDLEWYNNLIIKSIGSNHSQVWTTNINKLKVRYGDKFSNESATTRNLNKERQVLEENLAIKSKDPLDPPSEF